VLCVISTGMRDCLRVGIPIPYIHIYPMYVPCVPKKRPKRFVAFFQTLEALKRASCGLSSVALKRTSCDVWQLECQASNVTASVQSDHLLR